MANILFLAHRIPYPPNKGDKIRSWHFLSHLFEKHDVHLGFFIDDKNDLSHVPFLKEQAKSICFVEVHPSVQKIQSLKALLTNNPLTIGAYPYGRLRSYAQNLIDAGEVDLVFLFSAATGPIIPASTTVPVVTDLVDVDSQKWLSYSERSLWPLSWLYRREARKLGQYEAALARRSAATLLVSEQEAQLFSSLNDALDGKIHAVSNGVDFEHFTPTASSGSRKTVLFTGAMDYQPNVEAVGWFSQKVWPHVVKRHPGTIFRIAGGPVHPAVQALAKVAGVEVAGYVPDMASEIAAATVSVAPLQTARGIQNKVLEAMAMEKPVVATSLANEGINAEDGEAIIIADEPSHYVEQVSIFLNDAGACGKVGANARRFVEQNFTWASAFKKLDALVGAAL